LITNEEVRNAIMKLNYDENVGIIQDYVIQQEKFNKLLQLYRLGYSGSILSFVAYRDEIKKMERELNG